MFGSFRADTLQPISRLSGYTRVMSAGSTNTRTQDLLCPLFAKLLRRGSGLQAVLRATAMDRSANGQSGPGIEDEAVGGVDRPKLSAGGFHSALLLRRSLWWLLCVH